MWAISRFLYVALLPLAGCAVLSVQGWRTNVFVALSIVLGLLVYAFLQAVLISMEKTEKVTAKEMLRGILPLALVGVASGLSWERWIVEQMLLETGSFSLVIALAFLIKGSSEGCGGLAVVFALFVAPALGLIYLAGRALIFSREGSLDLAALCILSVAFAVAFYDGWKRFRPYVLGGKQMTDLEGSGWQMAAIIIWTLATLVGIPWLLV
ncbi:MAG: hypothetical protein AAF357_05270 [Verrucomicrobiota bacterium]